MFKRKIIPLPTHEIKFKTKLENMKLSIYSKIGISFVVLSAFVFFIAVSLFTYQGNVTPFIKKTSEITFLVWIPLLLIGSFILLYRFINRIIKLKN